jgi:hypothetical protein
VDETTNTLYVALSNRSFAPNVNGLGVVSDDGQHRQIRAIVPIEPLLAQSLAAAVDPDEDRV